MSMKQTRPASGHYVFGQRDSLMSSYDSPVSASASTSSPSFSLSPREDLEEVVGDVAPACSRHHDSMWSSRCSVDFQALVWGTHQIQLEHTSLPETGAKVAWLGGDVTLFSGDESASFTA